MTKACSNTKEGKTDLFIEVETGVGQRAADLTRVRETAGDADGANGVEPIGILDEVKLYSADRLRDGGFPLLGERKIVADKGNTVGVIGSELNVIQELTQESVGFFRRVYELVIEDVMQQGGDADERNVGGRGCGGEVGREVEGEMVDAEGVGHVVARTGGHGVLEVGLGEREVCSGYCRQHGERGGVGAAGQRRVSACDLPSDAK